MIRDRFLLFLQG